MAKERSKLQRCVDSFTRSLFLDENGKPKSATFLYAFLLSLLFVAVYIAAYLFLLDPLHEAFSGECVIVGCADMFKDMVDIDKCTDSMEVIKNGIRFIPFMSVGGKGLMPAFKPSKIYIKSNAGKSEIKAYIGLCKRENLKEESDLLVPSELVTKGS